MNVEFIFVLQNRSRMILRIGTQENVSEVRCLSFVLFIHDFPIINVSKCTKNQYNITVLHVCKNSACNEIHVVV